MRKALALLVFSLLLVACGATPTPPAPIPTPSECPGAIPSREAKSHVGEEKWVICPVASVELQLGMFGPVSVDLHCEKYPRRTLTVVMRGKVMDKYDYKEGMTVCVYGRIKRRWRAPPQITVWDSSQVRVIHYR